MLPGLTHNSEPVPLGFQDELRFAFLLERVHGIVSAGRHTKVRHVLYALLDALFRSGLLILRWMILASDGVHVFLILLPRELQNGERSAKMREGGARTKEGMLEKNRNAHLLVNTMHTSYRELRPLDWQLQSTEKEWRMHRRREREMIGRKHSNKMGVALK